MVFNEILCEQVHAPFSLSVTTAVISFALCLITVPGNILICIAIIKDPYKELATPFNYFVLQLALSDGFVGIFTEPAFIVWHIREAMKDSVMETISIVHLTYFISCTASLLSLSALTLDRYLTVMAINRRLSTRSVLRISAIIWFLSFTVPCVYFATGFYLFAFIFANTAVTATFVIVTFSYCRIYHKLRVQIARWGSLRQYQFATKAIAMERKLTRAFNLILLFFAFCLVPSCVMIYVINLSASCNCTIIHWLRDLQFILTLVNCSINQFLYAWRMPNFRRAIAAALCGKSVMYNLTTSPTTFQKAQSTNCRGSSPELLEFTGTIEDLTSFPAKSGVGTNHTGTDRINSMGRNYYIYETFV